ncbi:MAG: hypothetical protein Q4C58_05790 [Eubacteriales bacterium]|nr:hypothetical protein [Eubacteriales bacterium]
MKPESAYWKEKMYVCAQAMVPEGERKKAALDQIAVLARKKESRYRPGWRDVLKIQFTSVPRSIWAMQAVFFLLLPLAEGVLREKAGIYGWQIFPALSICMALGSAALVSELAGHFSHKTAELEQSCYLNLSQLWLMRACCVSGADVLAVIALGAKGAGHYGYGPFAFAAYVLTPFFLTNAALLAFFSLGRSGKKLKCAGILLLAGVGLWVEFFCGWIYEKVWLPVWAVLLAAAVLLCAVQAAGIGRKMEGEGVCWN